MQKEEFIQLAKKYAQNKCSWGEQEAVEEFFKKLQDSDQDIPYVFTEEKRDLLLKKISSKIGKPKKRLLPLYSAALKIAALVLILIGIPFLGNSLLKNENISVVAVKGEKKTIHLPDGSLVFLNSNSSISYLQNFKNNRELQLTGEAYFEVVKNPEKPFLVKTDKITTRVLGTSFNIEAYKNSRTKVSVNTGKVEVDIKEISEKTFLTKNQQLSFMTGSQAVLSKDNSEDFNAWTRNTIVLNNTSLVDAAKILENWYDIKINFSSKKLKEMTISGKFKDEKLSNVLKSIAIVKELEIDFLTKNQILIREKQKK
ncbi:FecR family protein [Flavobacterium frigidarium]|uniref:FecR domain-containing protein n=1 Tax=Flavobacterium frigidarium TaxID=99286 RepID=A0ABV4KC64_9FLAO